MGEEPAAITLSHLFELAIGDAVIQRRSGDMNRKGVYIVVNFRSSKDKTPSKWLTSWRDLLAGQNCHKITGSSKLDFS